MRIILSIQISEMKYKTKLLNIFLLKSDDKNYKLFNLNRNETLTNFAHITRIMLFIEQPNESQRKSYL